MIMNEKIAVDSHSATQTPLFLVRYYSMIANINQPITTKEEQRLRKTESDIIYLHGMINDIM